jgi:hypothetical protein
MKKLTFLIVLLLCVLIGAWPAFAGIKKLGQTGLQFLKADVGARAAAMAGANIMVAYDASAMFYNPAGLGKMTGKFSAFATYTQWIADIKYMGGAAAYNLGNWGVVGVSYQGSDYGEILGTRVVATTRGFEDVPGQTVGAYAIGLSYGRALTDRFTIGAQIKYCAQELGSNQLVANGPVVENKADGIAYDVGTIFYPGLKSLRFGMAIRNFSSQFKFRQEAFQLPLNFILGAAMDVLDLMGEHENPLVVEIDAHHPRDFSERLHVGAEYTLMNMVSLRAGYKFNYDEEGLTAGIGVQQTMNNITLQVGYAYSDFGTFDMVHRASVGVAF